MSLGLRPKHALLNDANAHLINFYEWLQRGLVIDIELRNDRDHYYEARQRFNSLLRDGATTSKEAAQLFYYLNRTGYNGLCRFNRKGFFNVPFGQYKKITYTADFRDYAPVLSEWEFSDGDYSHIAVQNQDLIYADPPYDVEFTAYDGNAFGWDEQMALAHWLAETRVPVIASNQATDRILGLYKELGFTIHVLDAPRRISCNGDRSPAKEMVATLGLAELAAS